MNYYDPAATCPKCGNPTITSEFLPAELPAMGVVYYPGRPHDVILRNCGRCTHAWNELPLDMTEVRKAEQDQAWRDEYQRMRGKSA